MEFSGDVSGVGGFAAILPPDVERNGEMDWEVIDP